MTENLYATADLWFLRGSRMFAVERQEIICRILLQRGSVSLGELTKKFAVSVETVRRDLQLLEKRGKLHRIHGGADG